MVHTIKDIDEDWKKESNLEDRLESFLTTIIRIFIELNSFCVNNVRGCLLRSPYLSHLDETIVEGGILSRRD